MVAAEEDDFAGLQDVSTEDEDYCYEDDLSDVETNLPGNLPGRRGQLSKKKSRGMLFKSFNFMIICFQGFHI